jgi:hypothetical protein
MHGEVLGKKKKVEKCNLLLHGHEQPPKPGVPAAVAALLTPCTGHNEPFFPR